MFSVDVERAHAPLGSVSSRWEGIRRPVRRHAVERRPAELLRGSGLITEPAGNLGMMREINCPFTVVDEGTQIRLRPSADSPGPLTKSS